MSKHAFDIAFSLVWQRSSGQIGTGSHWSAFGAIGKKLAFLFFVLNFID